MASKYNRGVALGEGTWGSVYEAFDKSDNKRVAIKRIKPMGTNLGLNFTALREIKYLTMLKHINIVEVLLLKFGVTAALIYLIDPLHVPLHLHSWSTCSSATRSCISCSTSVPMIWKRSSTIRPSF